MKTPPAPAMAIDVDKADVAAAAVDAESFRFASAAAAVSRAHSAEYFLHISSIGSTRLFIKPVVVHVVFVVVLAPIENRLITITFELVDFRFSG